jgi:hypothetical protein
MSEPSKYAMQIAEKITRFDISEEHDRVALLANPLKEIALKIDDLLDEQVRACADSVIRRLFLTSPATAQNAVKEACRIARLGDAREETKKEIDNILDQLARLEIKDE